MPINCFPYTLNRHFTKIQAAFGVSIQMLAEILNVSRPQLYKWLDPAKDIALQDASRSRLDSVKELADYWGGLTQQPLGPWLKEGGEAAPLLALLCEDPLPVDAIRREMAAQSNRVSEAQKSHSERLRDAGFRRRPSVRSLPSDE